MAPEPKKKVYEAPQLISESVFENAALACGKCLGSNPTGQLSCRALKKFS